MGMTCRGRAGSWRVSRGGRGRAGEVVATGAVQAVWTTGIGRAGRGRKCRCMTDSGIGKTRAG